MPTAMEKLADLGYTVGIANGSTVAEIEARTTAVLESAPEKLLQQAGEMAVQTVLEGKAIGAQPPAGMTWEELSAELAKQAYRMLTEGAEARVAHHDLALEIAEASPTVWHVAGFGLEVYIAIDDATGYATEESKALLDSLLDPDNHAERVFQYHAPSAVVNAVVGLRVAGLDVEKVSADEDGFRVKVAGAAVAKDEDAVAALVDRFIDAGE